MHFSITCGILFYDLTQRISPTAAEGLTRNTDFFEQVDLSHERQVEWKPSQVS